MLKILNVCMAARSETDWINNNYWSAVATISIPEPDHNATELQAKWTDFRNNHNADPWFRSNPVALSDLGGELFNYYDLYNMGFMSPDTVNGVAYTMSAQCGVVLDNTKYSFTDYDLSLGDDVYYLYIDAQNYIRIPRYVQYLSICNAGEITTESRYNFSFPSLYAVQETATEYVAVFAGFGRSNDGRYFNLSIYLNPNNSSFSITSVNLSAALDTFFSGAPDAKTDPYSPGGTSGPGGGTGTFDLTSDAVDFPALPTLTAVSTGLVSVYNPSLSQLNALATFLWNANITDVDWWKKLVANPLDLILGLSIVPCAVPAGAAQNIKVGLIDTGVSVTKAASQFVEVDCGSINIEEFYGAALDYLPFRKTSIYLPFIGTRTISTDDIMGKTVAVKYHIDLLSGACTAMVKCGDAVLYQYSGACAVSVPLTGETFTNMITSTIQLAASIGATVATGGAAAGITAASAANSVMSMKPTVERAGGVSGAAGQLGVMTPYLIGEIPRQSVPENYNQFAGYPSNITALLADLSGYTEIEKVFLQNIPATNAELEEIERLLKEGVIL